MYKNKKIVAIIPARRGSKGLQNKNMRILAGIPLIEHTLIEAKKACIIDKIIISTDSKEVYKIADKYGIKMNGYRPAELSNDTAILYDVIKYEIDNHKLIENGYEVLVLLQPTSPFRKSYMIEKALNNFIDLNQMSAVSVSEVEEHPIFMRRINNNELEKVLEINSTVRRQDLPMYYKINGMIYINKVKDIASEYLSLNDNVSPIIIPNGFDLDIDTIEDLLIAEKKIKDFQD